MDNDLRCYFSRMQYQLILANRSINDLRKMRNFLHDGGNPEVIAELYDTRLYFGRNCIPCTEGIFSAIKDAASYIINIVRKILATFFRFLGLNTIADFFMKSPASKLREVLDRNKEDLKMGGAFTAECDAALFRINAGLGRYKSKFIRECKNFPDLKVTSIKSLIEFTDYFYKCIASDTLSDNKALSKVVDTCNSISVEYVSVADQDPSKLISAVSSIARAYLTCNEAINKMAKRKIFNMTGTAEKASSDSDSVGDSDVKDIKDGSEYLECYMKFIRKLKEVGFVEILVRFAEAVEKVGRS